jgi:hypothetical protein
LSEHGSVSRGVCSLRADSNLNSITEHVGILATEVGRTGKFSGDEMVSMNCWGFTPTVFERLDTQLRQFLASIGARATSVESNPSARPIGSPPDPVKAEFYLPAAVSTMVARGETTVRVLKTGGTWFGVTYREDKPRVQAALAALVEARIYPAPLWE